MIIWFEDEKELNIALAQNHMIIMGIHFRICRWKPSFSTAADPRMVPIWVDLLYLKYEYFAPPFLKAIGNEIGHFLAMDGVTYKRSYTEIARICVEMDMAYDLPQEIYLESEDPNIKGY